MVVVMGAGASAVVARGQAKVQWVSNVGNDARSGLSEYEAKLTVMAAYDALPASGGTIYITSNAANGLVGIGAPGIWLLGSLDSQFATPPANWRVAKQVHFMGIRSVGGTLGSQGRVILQASSGTGPMIWLSYVNHGVTFENIQLQYPAVAIRIGVDSTNGDRNIPFCSGLKFLNVGASLNQIPGNGPTVDMGHSFWNLFDGCTLGGNLTADIDSDERAVVFADSGIAGASPLVHFRDCNFSNGGIRFYASSGSTWTGLLENVTLEGNFVDAVPPLYDLVRANNLGRMVVRECLIADAPGSLVIARIPAGTSPDVVQVETCHGDIEGPARVETPYSAGVLISPSAAGQYGAWNGRFYGRHDGGRRPGGLVAVRFPNLAPQDVSTWAAKGGTGTVTTGQTDPDGNTLAALITSGAGVLGKDIYRPAKTFVVGDRIIAGVWLRGTAAAGALSAAVAVTGSGNTMDTANPTIFTLGPTITGDGEWFWSSFRAVITATSGVPGELVMQVRADPTHPTVYYAPTLLYINAGTISDNEAAELEVHLASYPDGAVAGDLAARRGQKLYVGGRPVFATGASHTVDELVTVLQTLGLVKQS